MDIDRYITIMGRLMIVGITLMCGAFIVTVLVHYL